MDIRSCLSVPLARFIRGTCDALEELTSPIVDPVFRPAYEYVEETNSHWPQMPDKENGGIEPSWYTSPKQLVIEFVLWSVLFLFLMHKSLPGLKVVR